MLPLPPITTIRIYFLLLLNKTNGKTNNASAKASEMKEQKDLKKNKKDHDERGGGRRRKEREEEREEGQDADVLSEHALETYFEKLFFEYQQVLALPVWGPIHSWGRAGC
jgi:hypothetical protein